MRDTTQGFILLALSFFTMIIYFWAIFLSPKDVEYLGLTISEWAIIVPVMLIVYLFLVVVAWIGWAMVTTPPSLPPKQEEGKEIEQKNSKT